MAPGVVIDPALSRTLCRDSSAAGECGPKLVSRVDLQLAEDAREVTLDRSGSDEEGLGDLAVAEALASELGNTTLARCQRIEPPQNDPAWPRTRSAELGLSVLGERSGAGSVRGVERLAEQLPRFSAAIASPKHGAEVSEGARSFQPGVTALERVDRLTEQKRSTLTAGHYAGGTPSHAECARGAERLRELKLFFGQAFRRFVIAEREMGERGF